MTKVVFVNRFFYPDYSATSQLLTQLATSLQSAGLNVEILTSQQTYDCAGAGLPKLDNLQGLVIHRVGGTAFGRRNLPGRILDYLGFYFGCSLRLFRMIGSDDIVVAKTDPPLLGVVIAPIIWLRKARLINWYQDLFPEVAEHLGVRAPGFLYRGLAWLRDINARSASVNVVIGQRMSSHLTGRGVPAAQVRVIPNWFPHADAPEATSSVPGSSISLRKEWGLNGAFIVGYSGNLGRAHDWKSILLCARELHSHSNIRFLMIGGGAGMDCLKEQVMKLGLENVLFKPYQPLGRLSDSLSVSDVHLVSLEPSVADFLVPSKVYGIMAVGRPVIYVGSKTSEIGDLLHLHNLGETIEPENPAALSERILYLAENVSERERLGTVAFEAYRQHYSFPRALSQWQALLCAGIQDFPARS